VHDALNHGTASYAVHITTFGRDLRASRVAAVLATLLLAAGVGITWYAPERPSAPSSVVVVTTRAGTVACGQLRPSARSTIGVSAATFALADVAALFPAPACPK
jgi:hypothetical protein